MLVIIYLLKDEQELSLGMLICPKRIYNFCLLHAQRNMLFSHVSLPFSFCFRVLYQKYQKKVALFLLVVVTMGSTENTKLCDFTSHNNNDFICTLIALPTSAPSYEIKPDLLNLVMKDQLSVARDDALALKQFG